MARITKADLEAKNKELKQRNEEYARRILDIESKLDSKTRFNLENDERYINLVKERDMYKNRCISKDATVKSLEEDVNCLRNTIAELQGKLSNTTNKSIGGRPERFTGAEKEIIAIEYTHSSLRKLAAKYNCSVNTIKKALTDASPSNDNASTT